MFLGADYLEAHGLTGKADDYNRLYHDSLPEEMTLDGIYEKFNLYHPDDFKGHSLSVGDVIVLSRSGQKQAFFVDIIGFKELQDFIPAPVIEKKPENKQIKKEHKEEALCR